jgi:CRP-like cAMP-binding protein
MKVLRAYRELLSNGPLSRLLFGEFVSSIGDWLYLVAILILVYKVSEDPFILGLVGAARVLPYVFLSVPAGIVADRFDRRLVLLSTDVARGLIMLVIGAVVAVDGPLWLVVALTIGATCFSAFFGPAIGAYLPSLIKEEEQLGPANSAWSTLDQLAWVIGPAVAGILIAAGGLVVAFLLNAASFAVIALVMWRLPPNRPASAAAIEPDSAGGTVPRPPVGRDRAILVPLTGLATIDIVGALAGGGLSVLTVVIASENLKGGEAATGFLNAGIGLGGVVGAIVVSVLVLRPSLVPVVIGGSLVYGAGLVVLGLAPALGLAIAAIAVASAGSLLVEVSSTTIFQRVIPDAIRGRALGLLGTISTIAFAAGSFLVPVLADALGTAVVLAMVGAAIGLAGIVGAFMAAPAARRRAGSTADVRVTRLAELPLFAGVPAATLEAVASRLVPVAVAAGEIVIRQGDPADRFYLIEEGTFEVTRQTPAVAAIPSKAVPAALPAVPAGMEAVQAEAGAAAAAVPAAAEMPEVPVEAPAAERLRTMRPGEVFGEIGLLRGVPRTATVTAATKGRLLALDGADFLQLVNAGPQVGPRLMDLRRGAPGAGY